MTAVGLLLVLGAGPAEAKPRKPKQGDKIAVVVLTKGNPDPAILAELRASLERAAKLTPGVVVLSDRHVIRRSKAKNPARKLAACGTNLRCIAKFGRKVGATKVLYGRAMADGAGVKVGFLRVSTRGARVEGKVALLLPSVEETASLLETKAFEALGVTNFGSLEVPGAEGEVKVNGVVLGRGPGPYRVPTGRQRVEVEGRLRPVMVRAEKTTRVSLATPIALVLTAQGVPPGVVKEARQALGQALAGSNEVRLLSVPELRKGMGRRPSAAVTRCGSRLRCIARLGKKSGADQVVMGRIVPAKGDVAGVVLQFIRVDVASKKIVGKQKFDVAEGDDVVAAVTARARAIVGLEAGAPSTVAAAKTPPVPDAPPQTTPPASTEVASSAPVIETIEAMPERSPALTPPATGPSEITRGSSALTYAGIVVGGAGLLALGGGGFFAASSRSKNETLRGIQDGTESRSQIDTWQLVVDSDRAAGTANLLLTIGTVAAAAGGVLIGADFLFAGSDRPQIHAAVIPTAEGVGVVVGFDW